MYSAPLCVKFSRTPNVANPISTLRRTQMMEICVENDYLGNDNTRRSEIRVPVVPMWPQQRKPGRLYAPKPEELART